MHHLWSKSQSPYHGPCAEPCDGPPIPSLPSSPSVLTHSASAPGASSQSLSCQTRVRIILFVCSISSAWNILLSDIGMSCPHLLQVSNVSDSMRPSLNSLYTIASTTLAFLMTLLCFIVLHRTHYFLVHYIIYTLFYFVVCPPPFECGPVLWV